jgi:hypothetical protein
VQFGCVGGVVDVARVGGQHQQVGWFGVTARDVLEAKLSFAIGIELGDVGRALESG